jgi:molybdopterin-containing oxidoreductase family iron-sulfur binding subunit
MNRREFVQLVGLASGASLISSCGLERETEKLIPYLIPPDDGVIPGKPVFFATTCTECPAGCGISARVIDHKAAKLEGIEAHPLSAGALCVRGQSSIARVYHPKRLGRPLRRDSGGGFKEISWDDAMAAVSAGLEPGAASGSNHVFLSGRTTGTLSELIDEFCTRTGVERLPEFEVFSYAAVREANRILFGRREVPSYRIGDADFVLTVGSDLFETFGNPVHHACEFARARTRPDFNWVHVEPHVSLTGVQARERHAITAGGEVYLLAYLLRRSSENNIAGERRVAEIVELLPDLSSRAAAEKTGIEPEDLEKLAEALLSAKHPLFVIGGVSTMHASGLDAAVLGGLLQWSAGMIGTTVVFDASAASDRVGTFKDLQRLSDRLALGRIGVLIVSGADPVGATLGQGGGGPLETFKTNFARATLRVGIGDFMNPTLEACDVVLPVSLGLESWGDVVPRDDVHGLIQPAIKPVHDTRSAGDILIDLLRLRAGAASTTSYQEFLVGRLKETYGPTEVERMLSAGFVRRNVTPAAIALDGGAALSHVRAARLEEPSNGTVLIVAPSIRAFDGRGRDIALLSEVPDPLTTVSWGEFVSISHSMAGELGAADQDEIELSGNGWAGGLPAKIQPGLAKNVVVIHYRPGGIAPFGIDERAGEMLAVHNGIKVRRTGQKIPLPILSGSLSQQGRGVIPDDDGNDHHGEHGKHGEQPSFYPKHEHKDYRWGMAIDLGLCIGCSACAAACYVENNIPVVGPKRHLEGREMSWIRIEPFYDDEGGVEFQPMLCQHCDNAPCETVCPVYATYHNPEGLNAQVYNRCVGTRYCSNNCPYKVRRFNWFDFKRPTELSTTNNPEVSVRGRGIMEKCTFCVQRIRSARGHAKDENRRIKDGEVVPACAQTCPTNAIVFGNIEDEHSEVSKWARSERAHRVFEELGTRPAVYYLKSNWTRSHD